MEVVLFTPRSGSTYTAKKLAQDYNLRYAGEIFFSGPWDKEQTEYMYSGNNLNKLYSSFMDILVNGLDEYKDAVIKICPQQIRNICNRCDISEIMFFRMLKQHTSIFYFCIREQLNEQWKSLYAMIMLSSESTHAHAEWEGNKYILQDKIILEQCKNIIKSDLIMMSAQYSKMSDEKKQLLIYEDWSDKSDKYSRGLDFEFDIFDSDDDLKLSNYFNF